MSKAVLLLGKSGSGKSASYCKVPEYGIEGLNPKETVLINVIGKDLEMRKWEELYNETNKNYFVKEDCKEINRYLNLISEKTKFKNIVIDDFQYAFALKYIDGMTPKAGENGFTKFNKVLEDTANILRNVNNLRKDLIIYIITHIEEYNEGEFDMAYRFKAVGKGTHQYITPEGFFSIVLYAQSIEDSGSFKKVIRTKGRPNDTCKSPSGLFESEIIPNDLAIVEKNIREYYGI